MQDLDEPKQESFDPSGIPELDNPGQFLDEATDAFHIISPRGTIIWANKKELELLGYTKDEYVGHHISEFYADRFVINDILCRLVYNQEVVNYPAELMRKDGTKIQVLLNSKAYLHNGDLTHASSSIRDISELKIFQTRLENTNALVLNKLLNANTLLNLVASVTWTTDYQGFITSPQAKWQIYTGQEFTEQKDYGWLSAFHPDDRIAIRSNLIDAIKDNKDLRQLCRIFKKTANEYVYCGVFATPMIAIHSQTMEWTFILIDETKIIPPDRY